MAAQAEQNAADFLASTSDRAGQNFNVPSAVAERNCLAVQWAGVLSPQCVGTGIRRAAVAGAERAAMRSVAACAATALILVSAQHINGG